MEIIAHRGLTAVDRPENTVAAVQAALAAGADGVEVDVRLTADGVAVCCHDVDLSRLTGEPMAVADSDYDALATACLPGGHTVPPLAEVVARVAGRGRLIVEIKRPDAPAVAAAAVPVLRRWSGPAADLVLSSFDLRALEVIRRDLPWVRRALLAEIGVPARAAVRSAAARGHQEVHPHVSALCADPAAIDAAHSRGLVVRAWTVNFPGAAEVLRAAGADAVITDLAPDRLTAAPAASPVRIDA